jgi:hypothetical protein
LSWRRIITLPLRVDAMHLKNRLRDIETNCRNRMHLWRLRIMGALTAPTSMALTVPVEEPSTASGADSCTAAKSLFHDLIGNSQQNKAAAVPIDNFDRF